MSEKVWIFDTTLRDGEQSPGASMNLEEKLELALLLARLKVDVIEAGFPISSEGDFEAVQLVAREVKGPAIAGLSRCRKEDIEAVWNAVKYAERPVIHTFIATSPVHMERKLKMSPDEVLASAVEHVKFARSLCETVEFSAEDAGRTDIDFLCKVVEAVIKAGASVVNIPDTVGYTLPWEFEQRIRAIMERVPNVGDAIISVHCHNDLGLAVANSLGAVRAGARQVECTINGLGERAGNCALEEVVMAIKTRPDAFDTAVHTDIDTSQIMKCSRMVTEITGIQVQPNKAIVGANAFAHEAGIHQHGVMMEKRTYEIMDAEAVGLTESKLVLGKHSGRHAFRKKLIELGFELDQKEEEKAFRRFKQLADAKKDIYDEDIASIVADEVRQVPETYTLDYVTVVAGSPVKATATVSLMKGEERIDHAAIGVGPIDSIYKAISDVVKVEHTLVDFSVKSISGGTDALGEVTVKLGKGDRMYLGRGSEMDILVSAAKAYLNALNKMVYDEKN